MRERIVEVQFDAENAEKAFLLCDKKRQALREKKGGVICVKLWLLNAQIQVKKILLNSFNSILKFRKVASRGRIPIKEG